MHIKDVGALADRARGELKVRGLDLVYLVTKDERGVLTYTNYDLDVQKHVDLKRRDPIE